MQITLTIEQDYVVPEGALDTQQYMEFVANMAAKSYQTQYKVDTIEAGIEAARDAYNASLPEPEQS